jgi:hypothetical protein
MSDARFRFLRQESARLERQRASLRELDPQRAPEIRVIEAADFVTGGEADFARAANTRGIVVSSWRAGEGEARAEFLERGNPFIPSVEIEALRAQHNPLVFAQEFEAQFVNLAGVGLFNVEAMLNKGEPWPTPELFDTVFATLDSGVRGGQQHDASAVIYCGLNVTVAPLGLYVLDWEAVELGAGDLEYWFSGVGRTLTEYSLKTRMGSQGVYIERAGLGEMLLAKANSLGVLAEEIPSELVARGKDLRALAAERFINGGRVRLTVQAANKVSKPKGMQRNHLLAQTAGFHVADKDAWKRSDDLVDALVYAALTAFTVA